MLDPWYPLVSISFVPRRESSSSLKSFCCRFGLIRNRTKMLTKTFFPDFDINHFRRVRYRMGKFFNVSDLDSDEFFTWDVAFQRGSTTSTFRDDLFNDIMEICILVCLLNHQKTFAVQTIVLVPTLTMICFLASAAASDFFFYMNVIYAKTACYLKQYWQWN